MVKQDLRIAGTPLHINDVWIAAHALETGSILITYDRHFQKIAGLRRWDEVWPAADKLDFNSLNLDFLKRTIICVDGVNSRQRIMPQQAVFSRQNRAGRLGIF